MDGRLSLRQLIECSFTANMGGSKGYATRGGSFPFRRDEPTDFMRSQLRQAFARQANRTERAQTPPGAAKAFGTLCLL
jgi:hypothetical protein